MRLVGTFNEFGYQIEDVDGNVIYTAGNNPRESSSVVSLEHALDITEIMQFCRETGEDMAQDLDATFVGIQYIKRGM